MASTAEVHSLPLEGGVGEGVASSVTLDTIATLLLTF